MHRVHSHNIRVAVLHATNGVKGAFFCGQLFRVRWPDHSGHDRVCRIRTS